MTTDIKWQDLRQIRQQQLPARVRPWLLDKGSLTERLIKASDGDFHVKLIEQSWQFPTTDEALALGLSTRKLALVRTVLLVCKGEPWVCARSVIPEESLTGPLRFLRRLKNSALGALLFKDPNLKRSKFEVAYIDLPNPKIAFYGTGKVYGRRSLFFLKGKPLLVAEIFLPACQLDQKVLPGSLT